MGTLFIKALNDSPVWTTNSQGGVGRAGQDRTDAACSLATIPFLAPRQPQLQVLGFASFRCWEALGKGWVRGALLVLKFERQGGHINQARWWVPACNSETCKAKTGGSLQVLDQPI